MKMTVTGSWMVPMCEEAIDYLKYHNPELMWMLVNVMLIGDVKHPHQP